MSLSHRLRRECKPVDTPQADVGYRHERPVDPVVGHARGRACHIGRVVVDQTAAAPASVAFRALTAKPQKPRSIEHDLPGNAAAFENGEQPSMTVPLSCREEAIQQHHRCHDVRRHARVADPRSERRESELKLPRNRCRCDDFDLGLPNDRAFGTPAVTNPPVHTTC